MLANFEFLTTQLMYILSAVSAIIGTDRFTSTAQSDGPSSSDGKCKI